MNSKFLSVNTQEFLKGLGYAVSSAVIAVVFKTIQEGSLSFDWSAIAIAALAAGLGYIQVKLLSNSEGKFMKKESK